MKSVQFILLFLSVLKCFGDYRDYLDLSYVISNETVFFPGVRKFELTKDKMGWNDEKSIWYSSFSFCMGEHGGTHLDAPFHFNQHGMTVVQIPPQNLLDIPGAVIDVTKEVNQLDEPGTYELSVADIINYEKKFSMIPLGSVVIVYTGWSNFWPDPEKYLGKKFGSVTLTFPGVSEEAAKWLYTERQIVGLGIDTPSVDNGNSKKLPVHVYLAQLGVYNLENVANLHLINKFVLKAKDQVKPSSCDLRLHVIPLRISEATGSPTRILAFCKKN